VEVTENIKSGDSSTGEFDRRKFIKRATVASAVAVPLVSSVSMAGVSPAFAQEPGSSGGGGNQPPGGGGNG
jgi:hypothetical protein